jgi:cytochrome P450
MFIPKGTILLPNMWGIAHDPEIYADPDEFTPERFLRTDAHGQLELDPDVFDPITLLFGYGRRYALFTGPYQTCRAYAYAR